MNKEFEDDDNDMYDLEASREALERSKQEFIKGCYDAYELLVTRGPKALEEAPVKEIQKAINRMTQLFLLREEYERCGFLKQYVSAHMPEFEIVPDPSVVKELSL